MNMIWNDRQGRLSPLKSATLAVAIVPALVIAYWFYTGALQPLSVKNAIHLTGDWAIRFLVLTLALTPLQRMLNYPKIALIRRMMGVTAFAYALAHFSLYIISVKFDLGFVVSEIYHRFYLTIGFAALLGLSALAATSFDAAVRKLGQNWKRLHKIAYGLAVLGLFHYFLQSKIDVAAATWMAGLFLLAMVLRVMVTRRISLTPPKIALAAMIACLLTAATEYAWYGLATGINPARVFIANFSVAHGLRPALITLSVGLAVAAIITMKDFRNSGALSRQSASR
jgi:methionine sulfoxide reductase heme-binding subunit